MAYLVAPGNHIAPLGDIPDATVGSDARCTLGIRGDFGLEPVHFHLFRTPEQTGAKVVPADPTNTPVCINGKIIPATGAWIGAGDAILAGFIELIYQDDDEAKEVPIESSAFFEGVDEIAAPAIDPIAELLDLPSPSTISVPPHETAPAPVAPSVAPNNSHLPSAAAPNAPAAVPAAMVGGILHLPKRTAPPLASAVGKTMEAFRRSAVRWSIRAAVALFFMAIGSSLLNARFPMVQNFWSDVGLKVKHVLDPVEINDSSGIYGGRERDA